MQIYKVFMKLLKKHSKALLIYAGIFLVVTSLMSNQTKKNSEAGFTKIEIKFAVFDYDQSEASRQLTEYVKEKNKYVSIKEDKAEVIQDELYNRTINCVLRIPEGFEESLKMQGTKAIVEVVGIPNTNQVSSFKSQINHYLKLLKAYLASGESLTQAYEHTKETASITTQVRFVDQDSNKKHSGMYYFFLLCVYPFIGMCFDGIGAILLVFKKKELNERIQCSASKFSSFHAQLFLGILTTGALIWAIFAALGMALSGSDSVSIRGVLFILQMACIMVVVLAMAYMISKVVNNEHSLTMIANIIGLGICFLCGIFVPIEYLGENVIKIARFLPGYWYALGCKEIDRYTSQTDLTTILSYFGIELLFAVVFVAISLAVSRLKYQSK